MSIELIEEREMQYFWDKLTESISKFKSTSEESHDEVITALDSLGEKVKTLGSPPGSFVYGIGASSKKSNGTAQDSSNKVIRNSPVPLTEGEFSTLLDDEQVVLIKNAESVLNKLLTSVEEARAAREASYHFVISETVKWQYWLTTAVFQKLGPYVNLLSKGTLERIFWSPELLPQKQYERFRNIYLIDAAQALGAQLWADKYLNGDLRTKTSYPLDSALSNGAKFASKVLIGQEDKPGKKQEKWTLILDYPKSSATRLLYESLTIAINHERAIKEKVSTELTSPEAPLSPQTVSLKGICHLMQFQSSITPKSDSKTPAVVATAIVGLINDYIVVIREDYSKKEWEKLQERPDSCCIIT